MDHIDYVRDQFFNPIRKRVIDLLEQHKIDFATESMTRLTMGIDEWEVEFDGLMRATSDGGSSIILRGPNYHKVTLVVKLLIDTIPAGKQTFQFVQAIKDHSHYAEAIDGAAWGLFNIASPILKDGFPDEQKDS